MIRRFVAGVATLGIRFYASACVLNCPVSDRFEILSGGTIHGHVGAAGRESITLGPGKSSISRRYDVPGLRIILFQARGRADSERDTGLVRARCFDRHGRKVMEVSQAFDPKKIRDGAEAGVYFKTQANTVYIVVGIEASNGAARESRRWNRPSSKTTTRIASNMHPNATLRWST